MQLRLLAASVLFLGSYLPLSLILLAQDFKYESLRSDFCHDFASWNGCSLPFQNPVYSISIFIICLICFLISLTVLQTVRVKREIIIKEANHVPAELMNYTLPYVVSFMSISYQETGKFVGLLIFLGWMFWITYKSGQIILNPVLSAFGWRLFSIRFRFAGDTTDYTRLALAKNPLSPAESHRTFEIQDVIIIRNKRND